MNPFQKSIDLEKENSIVQEEIDNLLQGLDAYKSLLKTIKDSKDKVKVFETKREIFRLGGELIAKQRISQGLKLSIDQTKEYIEKMMKEVNSNWQELVEKGKKELTKKSLDEKQHNILEAIVKKFKSSDFKNSEEKVNYYKALIGIMGSVKQEGTMKVLK